MRIVRKDLNLLSEAYDSMNNGSTNQDYKVGDIVTGYDGEEVIVSVEGDQIYTRVLDPGGNQYTSETLAAASSGADESEEGMGGSEDEESTKPPRDKLRFMSRSQNSTKQSDSKRVGPPTKKFRPFSQHQQ